MYPLRTPVKDVFPFATWLGSISTFRVRVGSFNYRCTRASVRRKVDGWQSTINWTDCRSPVQLALRNPFELTRLRLQIVLPVNVLVFSFCNNKRGYPNRTILILNLATNKMCIRLSFMIQFPYCILRSINSRIFSIIRNIALVERELIKFNKMKMKMLKGL